MSGISISEAAERTGFSPSALRFYERSGLVAPDRTPGGYRRYDERQLERLGFIGRAKGFGLTLDEIVDLLEAFGEDECAPLQARLRALVTTKRAEVGGSLAALQRFQRELDALAASLEGHTPAGPCDDRCGCRTDAAPDAGEAAAPVPVASVARPRSGPSTGATAAPIACTLGPSELDARLDDWRRHAAAATERHPIPGGVRLHLPPGTDLAALASLVAAEQGCCAFFTFTLTLAPEGLTLDVTAPDEARLMVDQLLGDAR